MNRRVGVTMTLAAAMAAWFAINAAAQTGTGYGSLNNFDAVNDNNVPCHGFEIEIEDCHSKDITYTYDWNHYGVPNISEDNSDPLHPRVFVRYESKKNPDGSWVSFTAVPAGPIAPTDGHQFTNPSVNFGGEHFGVGFYGAPTAVRYHWLIDDGGGNLIHGTAVSISTPAFNYMPPAGGFAQVQAVIVPPPPPAPPPLEFGEASWVKETRTQTHNNNRVELRDLVSDDPNDPNDRNWKNGEPDEVEVEWQLLQTDYNSGDGGPNGKLEGAPEGLPNGDEIITRRYDFYKYIGPLDAETGEARAQSVGPDGIHGEGIKIIDGVEVDLSTVEVVGEYIGAQMAGFDPAGQIGLVDHLQDGEVNSPYVERTLVVGGTAPIVTTRTGPLPDGMTFDEVSGVLSGTPTVTGTFTFTVHSTDAAAGDVSTTYRLTVLAPGAAQPLHFTVTTLASPPEGGITTGDGEYDLDTTATVTATANPGYAFAHWTDGGTIVSASSSYEFAVIVNRELEAHFEPTSVQAPVDLGLAASFAVLAGSAVSNSALATTIDGDLGVSPGTAVTGFPPGVVINGAIHAGDPAAALAQADLGLAYTDAAGRTSTDTVILSGNLGGMTLTPGLYKSTSSLEISAGDLILDGAGDPDAVFIFQMASTFTTTVGRRISLIHGAKPANIFWQVGSSATLGTSSVMQGNILALQSITMNTSATLEGRALALNGAVSLDGNRVTNPTTVVLPTPTATATPTATETATPTATETATPTATETETPIATETPTATATDAPTATATEAPTATAPPTETPSGPQDSDHDGFSDSFETSVGSNPNDPASFPPGLDLDGDGSATVLDALLLYRNRVGQIPVIPLNP